MVGERLITHMEKKCLKQASVARMAGYTPKQFNDLLHGRKILKEKDVTQICAALNLTPNDLFGWTDHDVKIC